VDPESFHRRWFLHGLRDGEKYSLNDSAKVAHVEEVVRLGRSGQEFFESFLVDDKSPIHQLIHTRLELTRKPSVNTTSSLVLCLLAGPWHPNLPFLSVFCPPFHFCTCLCNKVINHTIFGMPLGLLPSILLSSTILISPSHLIT